MGCPSPQCPGDLLDGRQRRPGAFRPLSLPPSQDGPSPLCPDQGSTGRKPGHSQLPAHCPDQAESRKAGSISYWVSRAGLEPGFSHHAYTPSEPQSHWTPRASQSGRKVLEHMQPTRGHHSPCLEMWLKAVPWPAYFSSAPTKQKWPECCRRST